MSIEELKKLAGLLMPLKEGLGCPLDGQVLVGVRQMNIGYGHLDRSSAQDRTGRAISGWLGKRNQGK
jgi:hypothetical protein